MLRFLIESCFSQVLIRITSNLVLVFILSYSSICWCLQADIFDNFLHFMVFSSLYLLRKTWPVKVLRFLIKSRFLWSSHQNLIKFDTWIHCIVPINMWVITCWYILLFSVFFIVFFFSIFHHNFYFFVAIIWNFHLRVWTRHWIAALKSISIP